MIELLIENDVNINVKYYDETILNQVKEYRK